MTAAAIQLYRSGSANAHPGTSARHGAPELAIVIPTFNEAENVALIVAALDRALHGIAWEVLFVDDDSADGTARQVFMLAEADSRVRCIRRIGRRGLSGAAIEGMLAVSADVIAVMDGDLQHDETVLPEMLEAIRASADIAIATRFGGVAMEAGGLSLVRAAGSGLAARMAGTLLGTTVSDPMSGFFMIRRRVVHELAPKLSIHGFKILLDILVSSNGRLKIAEVPFTFRTRKFGASKLDSRVVFEFLGLLLAKYTGDAVSMRFVLFGLVGASGLVVHLIALRLAMSGGVDFTLGQTAAAYSAMTWNFFLNNALTYRDQRLTGVRMLQGLATFYAACSLGALANVGAAQLIFSNSGTWWIAGTAGAVMGAIFNYAATARLTWRRA
ncbi:MAG: glycosyltransferase family 2 protein [Hyphomicrobium sp.]